MSKPETNTPDTPFSPADWIVNQDGAVVSRTLIKKKTGTVTLMAFDTGQELSEHAAPFDALVYGLSGTANISIGKDVHPLKEGEMLVLPANIPHALEAITPFKMMLTMIRDA